MIRKNFMESFQNELTQVMHDITQLFNEYDIEFTFIGGSVVNQYGHSRTTDDVDILVNKEDIEKMKELPIGWIREISKGRMKVFTWHDPKTKVEVIYSGEISGDGVNGLPYKKPLKVSILKDGVPILTLYELVKYKLSAGIYGKRNKDFADVEELIKINKLPMDYANNDSELSKICKDKYIELWDNAQIKNPFYDFGTE